MKDSENKYIQAKRKIDNLTKSSSSSIEYSHSQSVLKWLLKLKPEADIALKLSALGHDIDRSFGQPVKREDFKTYEEFKMKHAARSASILRDILSELDFDGKIIEKVVSLVKDHEIGGSGDVEILKEADSLSFFDNNLEHYMETRPDYMKDKIKFMYSRLSPKARDLVKKIKFKKEMKNIVLETIKSID